MKIGDKVSIHYNIAIPKGKIVKIDSSYDGMFPYKVELENGKTEWFSKEQLKLIEPKINEAHSHVIVDFENPPVEKSKDIKEIGFICFLAGLCTTAETEEDIKNARSLFDNWFDKQDFKQEQDGK